MRQAIPRYSFNTADFHELFTINGVNDAERWFERGLKDPAACVRMEVAKLLSTLDRIEHRTLFDIARHDPNPAVKRSARKRH